MRRRSTGIFKTTLGLLMIAAALTGILYWNSAAHLAARMALGGSFSPVGGGAGSQTGVLAQTTASVDEVGGALGGGLGSGRVVGALQAAGADPVPASKAAVSAVIARGTALAASGNLLDARALVNSAVVSGGMTPADAVAAKAFLKDLNQTLVFSPQRFANDPAADVVSIKKGDLLMKIANTYLIPHDLILKINGLADARKIRVGQQLKVIRGPFHAVVNKREFTIEIYLKAPGGPDSLFVTSFSVGLGTDNSTPSGLWTITPQNKLKNPTYFSPRGQGIIQPGDPANPLGHYWLGLTGLEGQAAGQRSYGIHGTIDPTSIGKQSSMGCIRLNDDDIAQVFLMLFEGKSTVRVVD